MARALNILFLVADADHTRLVTLSRDSGDYRTLIERRSDRPPDGNRLRSVFQRFDDVPEGEGGGSSVGFLERVVDEAAALVAEGGFEGIALIAPAEVLQRIRKRIPGSVKIVGELAKDLTKLRNHDLAAWLSAARPRQRA